MLLRVRHSAEMEHVLVSRFGSSCELQLTHHGFLTASLRLAHDRGASQRLAPPANLVAFLTPVRNPAPMHTLHAVESRGPLCGAQELSCALHAPSPLDVPEQSCGVCLPACAHEAGEATAPRPQGEGRHCVRAHGAPCHSRARRFGVMSSHRIGKASGERRCWSAASLIRPCGALPLDNLARRCPGRTLAQTGEHFLRKLCAKNRSQFCCLTFAGHATWRGTSRVAEIAEKEFPVSRKASCAISCRAVSGQSRAGSGAGRSLTPRTPIPRLPGLCSSGPLRSELSARSADRGRVVPVLDRSSGRSPIAPFAPSFP
jgi:hypothetical protein